MSREGRSRPRYAVRAGAEMDPAPADEVMRSRAIAYAAVVRASIPSARPTTP